MQPGHLLCCVVAPRERRATVVTAGVHSATAMFTTRVGLHQGCRKYTTPWSTCMPRQDSIHLGLCMYTCMVLALDAVGLIVFDHRQVLTPKKYPTKNDELQTFHCAHYRTAENPNHMMKVEASVCNTTLE